jgi:hypothetical protein
MSLPAARVYAIQPGAGSCPKTGISTGFNSKDGMKKNKRRIRFF